MKDDRSCILVSSFIPHPSSLLCVLYLIRTTFSEDALSRFFVTGGAGFIGGHLVARLLTRPDAQVTVYDNFTSGRSWHLQAAKGDEKRLHVVSGDIKDLGRLREAMAGADTVFHLASNP